MRLFGTVLAAALLLAGCNEENARSESATMAYAPNVASSEGFAAAHDIGRPMKAQGSAAQTEPWLSYRHTVEIETGDVAGALTLEHFQVDR